MPEPIESGNKQRKKDGWDKFGVISQFVSGVVITFVGAFFTYSYHKQQYVREQQATELQRVQTIGTFMPFLTNKDPETKQLALTQVQSLLGTKSAVSVALQVNAAAQANAPASKAQGERAEPDPAVANALQVIATRANTEGDRKLASDALAQITCGHERWLIKTLSDRDAATVASSPIESSVARLIAIPRPSTLPPDTRIDPIERQTFKVVARLIRVKKERDGDYHLDLADPAEPEKTMIAEIPSPHCYNGVDPGVAAKFRDARSKLDQVMRGSSRGVRGEQSFEVSIIGVGFFDFMRGQHGMAPNGLELHPVLALDILHSRNSATH